MGSYKDNHYYDHVYKTSDSYGGSWKDSIYVIMRIICINLIKEYKRDVKILEIGCGVGHFARMLELSNFTNYEGFDFSEQAIKMAKINTNQKVYVADALDLSAYSNKDYDLIISMEVFEHTYDLEIIGGLRQGVDIIITLPDFDDPAHLRYFSSKKEIKNYYKDKIVIDKIIKHKKWFIIKGTVK